MFFERMCKCNCSTARKEKNTKNKIKRINQDLIADVGKEIGNHLGKTCTLYKVSHSVADFGGMLKKVVNSSFAYDVKEMEGSRYCLLTLF